MKKIAPSLLSADFSKLNKEIKAIEKAGADLLHLDVMDGKFVPNITMGPVIIKSLRDITELPFDVHLMIDKPERYIKDFVDAGADIITVHVESTIHLHRTIQLIKSYGVKVGVALNPSTPLESLEYVLEDVDMVLIMTVNPGFGGQKLIDNMENKIKKLKNTIESNNLLIDIQVDGGIKIDNIEKVSNWGADIFVAGSAVFKSDDYKKTIEDFRSKL